MLIVGGGIGGLAAGIALAQHGIAARILERRRESSEAGAGIQLGPNGVRALRLLGVERTTRRRAGKPSQIIVHDGASGTGWRACRSAAGSQPGTARPTGRPPRRSASALLWPWAMRAESSSSQASTLPASRKRGTASKLTAGDGSTVEGVALVGADGLWSVVRAQLFPDAVPAFAERLAARTVLPASVARGVLAEPATGMWLAPGVHVVHYPVRGGREIAVVVIAGESTPQIGWSTPLDAGQLEQKLAPFARELRDVLDRAEEWRAWSLYDAIPLPSWSRGRVALLGDAVHPVLPFLAQGGGMALEGAATLGGLLAESSGEPATAFQRYEDARRRRVARVQAAARRNGAAYRLSGFAARARDRLLGVLPGTRVMAAYDWIYGWKGDDLD